MSKFQISDEDLADDFHLMLIDDYNANSYPLIFYLKVGIICVVRSTKNWQRCRLLKLYDDQTCDVFLLDIGTNERVKWKDLRALTETYLHQKPFAIRCELVNSTTANPINRFSLTNQNEFIDILQKNKEFYIYVNRSGPLMTDIFLYYKSADKFHCVNDIFPRESFSDSSSEENTPNSNEKSPSSPSTANKSTVASTELAMKLKESSESSKSTDSIDLIHSGDSNLACNANQPLTKSPIISTNHAMQENSIEHMAHELEMQMGAVGGSPEQVVSKPAEKPNKFNITAPERVVLKQFDGIDAVYICFEKHLNTLKDLHFDVQEFAQQEQYSNQPTNDQMKWNVDSYCLVRTAVDTSREWFRGKVLSIDGEECTVFLRDVGKRIKSQMSELKPISIKLNEIRNLTWKWKLAMISMKTDGTAELKRAFRRMTKQYREMAISVLDANVSENQIILWGIEKIYDPMLPERIVYVNINEKLVESGHVTSLGPLANITNKINSREPNNNDERDAIQEMIRADGHIAINPQQYRQVTDEIMEINKWLPSERIAKKKFAAIPTYVSQRCIISVLGDNRNATAEQIQRILDNKQKAKLLEKRDALEWKKGDACFAPFVDQKFYRASVRRLNLKKSTCVVSFSVF